MALLTVHTVSMHHVRRETTIFGVLGTVGLCTRNRCSLRGIPHRALRKITLVTVRPAKPGDAAGYINPSRMWRRLSVFLLLAVKRVAGNPRTHINSHTSSTPTLQENRINS